MSYEPLNITDHTAIDRLLRLCQDHALHFRLEYSEAEDRYELEVWGIGKGESFYVKGSKFLRDAVGFIEDQWLDFQEKLKNPSWEAGMTFKDETIPVAEAWKKKTH